ncbi:MAG: TonB-dependent receptor family protein, partial [Cyclobacteriaceae bacterium]
SRQPGGLSDIAFDENAQQSNRDRNWFKVNWNLASFSMEYHIKPKLTLYSKLFSLVARRTSLGLRDNPTKPDIGKNRDLLDGKFRNIGNETKLVHNYSLGKQENTFLLGARLYRGLTNFSQGFGTDGSGADFSSVDLNNLNSLTDEKNTSDIDFPNFNLALFTENIIRLSKNLSLIPGIRYEYIQTKAEGGFIENGLDSLQSTNKNRHLLLIGLGSSLKITPSLELYSNITSNYRAINFTDIQVTSATQVVDPNTTDERGYSLDIGLRKRNYNKVYLDASLFFIRYANRIGTILDDGLQLRTNIGKANIYGFESFVDFNILKIAGIKRSNHKATVFINSAVSKGFYRDINERASSGVRSGNRIENLPLYNIKSGISYGYKDFGCSFQGTYISAQYSDANNSTLKNESTNGVQGVIPAYFVLDFSAKYVVNKRLNIGLSVNNITDVQYFTRRATGYPGPGILPAQGRTWFLSAGLTF